MIKDIKNNPFSRVFGKEPKQSITRLSQTEEILGELLSEMPGQQIFMVTGVRGSGKTVLMTEICARIRAEKEWIVVELNPAKDMLTGLASKLYEQKGVAKILDAASINLSAFGIGVGVKGSRPVTDIEVAIERILSELKKKNKRVMVAIAGSTEGKTAEIRKQVGMETNIFSTYRERLIKKGVINGETRGYVKMALPFFREFVLDREAEMEAM